MAEVVDLIRDLGSPDQKRRMDAIDQIGRIGAKDPDGIVVAISPMVANLANPDKEVKRRTLGSLAAIGRTKPNLLRGVEATVRECLKDDEKTVRLRAIEVLAAIRAQGFTDVKTTMPMVKHYLIDPNPEVFATASKILKAVGINDPELVEILDPIEEARGLIRDNADSGKDFSKVQQSIKKALVHLVDSDYKSARKEAMSSLKALMDMKLAPAKREGEGRPGNAPSPHGARDANEEEGDDADEGAQAEAAQPAESPRSFIPKAEELLEKARQAYERGEFAEVERITQQIEALASRSAKEYYDEEVQRKIKNAEEFINEARTMGGDVAKAESLLTNAREAMNNGYFDSAINYVNQTLAAVKAAKKDLSPKKASKQDAVAVKDGLNEGMRFDNFVVGNNSRFVTAAAQAVAKKPAETYNPLFIYGGAGLGKTHLLNAIGNETKKLHPDLRIRCVSSEKITADLIDAIRKGQLDDFHKGYRSVDVLLIDDIHFLAGKESTQEEFFNTFNSLYSANKQIVITSDRPPSNLQNLTDRIVSRLEGGLIADIQPPNIETKIAILESQLKEDNIVITPEILNYIASKVKSNIRSLKGALKKVLAYANVTDNRITLSLVDEVFKSGIDEKATKEEPHPDAAQKKDDRGKAVPAAEPAAGPAAEGKDVPLEPGISYLVEEERPKLCFELYEKFCKSSGRGLCITRSNPKLLEKKYNLEGSTVLWLTDSSVNEPKIYPKLESMMYTLEEFIDKKTPGVLLLDGIEYLISIHGFSPTLKFLREIVDDISMSSVSLLIPLNPAAIDKQEASMLERELETISR